MNESKDPLEGQVENVQYSILPSGHCMVCEMTMKNGIVFRGMYEPLEIADFDKDVGKQVSLGMAELEAQKFMSIFNKVTADER